MPKKGIEKQVPQDQRARGMNHEHQEGKDNFANTERQQAAAAPPTGGKGATKS